MPAIVIDLNSAVVKNSASTSWQRDDLIPASPWYSRTQSVSSFLRHHAHPLPWHHPRLRAPCLKPQPCLRAAHAATPAKVVPWVSGEIRYPCACPQTPQPHSLPSNHPGGDSALQTHCDTTGLKHRAYTPHSTHFFWATTNHPSSQCVWCCQHSVCFLQLIGAALPWELHLPLHVLSWVILDSQGHPALLFLHRCCKLAALLTHFPIVLAI